MFPTSCSHSDLRSSRRVGLQKRLQDHFPTWSAAQLEVEDDDEALAEVEALLQRLAANPPGSAKQRTQEMLQAAEEYSAEAARLQMVLMHVGITPESLSPEARRQLAWVATEASSLGLARSSDASILAAWVLLCQDHAEATLLQERIVAQNEQQQRAVAAVTDALAELHSYLTSTRKAQAEEAPVLLGMQRDAPMLESKVRSYEANIASMQRKLLEAGAAPQLYHSALVAQEEERDRLQQKLQEAQQQLAAFHGLPPSLPGAEAALRRLEHEHLATRAELDRKLVEA